MSRGVLFIWWGKSSVVLVLRIGINVCMGRLSARGFPQCHHMSQLALNNSHIYT